MISLSLIREINKSLLSYKMFQITNVQFFAQLGIQIEWKGEAENEIGKVKSVDNEKLHAIIQPVSAKSKFDGDGSSNHAIIQSALSVGDTVISIDPNYYRPTEVDLLIGNPSKAREKLDWEAETKLEELVKLMVESDIKKVLEKGY